MQGELKRMTIPHQEDWTNIGRDRSSGDECFVPKKWAMMPLNLKNVRPVDIK